MNSTSYVVPGVVALSKGAPAKLVDVHVPAPGRRDVIVTIQACGVCHTDYSYQQGGVNNDFPFLLGHEAAGVVEAIGSEVTHVKPGDFVILNWRAVCGDCRACKRGKPQYCFNTFNAEHAMTLADGTALTPALGIGAFIEKTIVHELQCTKVNPHTDPAVACLLGCGVMAGIGAAMNTGQVGVGDSVAVIGCGGVGNAAVAGATLAGATTIIAIDYDDSKLQIATSLGATHTINSKNLSQEQLLAAVTNIVTHGTDVAIDAVGRPETWTQAFYIRDLAGVAVLVGVPTPDMTWEVPFIDVFSHGGALKSAWYGDCLPERDFPALIDLYHRGKLPLETFVSERISLHEVEEAFTAMKQGKVLRSVVIL